MRIYAGVKRGVGKDGNSRYLCTQRTMLNIRFANLKRGFDAHPHGGCWLVGRETREILLRF